jgi:hypothetical protein
LASLIQNTIYLVYYIPLTAVVVDVVDVEVEVAVDAEGVVGSLYVKKIKIEMECMVFYI